MPKVKKFTAGEAITENDCCYINDSSATIANATNCVGHTLYWARQNIANGADGMFAQDFPTSIDAPSGAVEGQLICLNRTDGAYSLDPNSDLTTGDYVRAVGYAYKDGSGNVKIYAKPSIDFFEKS